MCGGTKIVYRCGHTRYSDLKVCQAKLDASKNRDRKCPVGPPEYETMPLICACPKPHCQERVLNEPSVISDFQAQRPLNGVNEYEEEANTDPLPPNKKKAKTQRIRTQEEKLQLQAEAERTSRMTKWNLQVDESMGSGRVSEMGGGCVREDHGKSRAPELLTWDSPPLILNPTKQHPPQKYYHKY